jgi:3-hydroxybutyryl-CoA dehydrogenase
MREMGNMQKVAVIGAGLMGTGIAHAFAVTGHDVAFVDVNPAALQKAVAEIRSIVDAGVRLKKISEVDASATMGRITPMADLKEAVTNAHLAIETASEQLPVKLSIIREIDTLISDDAIIATNTSALSITEIAAASRRPQRVAGMHFFNPVHKMKLVEIVRGLATSDEAIAKLRRYAEALGKTAIVVADSPGFTTSRISAILGNEAMYMLSEGVASAEDIDTALRLGFGHPMGPLELGDLTGWDTRLSVIEYLHRTFGEKFRPCPLMTKMVKSGRIGRKVGRGVYEYVDGAKVAGSGLSPV